MGASSELNISVEMDVWGSLLYYFLNTDLFMRERVVVRERKSRLRA